MFKGGKNQGNVVMLHDVKRCRSVMINLKLRRTAEGVLCHLKDSRCTMADGSDTRLHEF